MSASMATRPPSSLLRRKASGGKPPADVFFGPNNGMRALTKAGVVANLPLVAVVPEAKDLDKQAALAPRLRAWRNGPALPSQPDGHRL